MAGLIFKKMNEVMKEIGAISKDQKNQQQGFKFRGIDQFVNALYPALTKHGVFMTTEVLSETHELKEVMRASGKNGVDKHVSIHMKYTFHAEDGSSVSSSIPAEGLDSGDKATNKALSAALKYALIQTFSIPTEDMEEGDKTSPEIGFSERPKPNLAARTAEIDLQLNQKEKEEIRAAVVEAPTPSTETVEPRARTTFRKSSPTTPVETTPAAPSISTTPSRGGLNFK